VYSLAALAFARMAHTHVLVTTPATGSSRTV